MTRMIPPSHSLAIAFALLASTSAGKSAAVLAFAPSLPPSRTNALEPRAAARNGKSAGGRRGDGDMDVDDVIASLEAALGQAAPPSRGR